MRSRRKRHYKQNHRCSIEGQWLSWPRRENLDKSVDREENLKSQVSFPLLAGSEFRGTGVNIGTMGQHRLENKAVVQQFLNETATSTGPLSREVTTDIIAESEWRRVLGLATPVQSVVPGKQTDVDIVSICLRNSVALWLLFDLLWERRSQVWDLQFWSILLRKTLHRVIWFATFPRANLQPCKAKLTFSLTGYLEDLSIMLKLPSWEDKEQLRDHPNSYNHRNIKNKEFLDISQTENKGL